jgi:hypothetical protein
LDAQGTSQKPAAITLIISPAAELKTRPYHCGRQELSLVPPCFQKPVFW